MRGAAAANNAGSLLLALVLLAEAADVGIVEAAGWRSLLGDKKGKEGSAGNAKGTSLRLLVRIDIKQSSLNTAATGKFGIASAPSVTKVKQLHKLGSLIVETTDLAATRANLEARPDVSFVEIDQVVRLLAGEPNDPQWASLWGMQKIGATTAWATTKGSKDVVVCVIDTGVDYNHPDLAANIWTNPGEIAGNGIDDDGNGKWGLLLLF
jgi:subtilisin family serine protease